MRLSVVILNYQVRYFLEQCLDSVLKATKNLDAEIIVVDNHSSDDSCQMVRMRFPQVTLLAHHENAGFPKGNNLGVAVAKGEYILILNPDTLLAEDTLEQVISHYEKLDNPGILGVKLVDGAGNFLPESKRGTPTPFVAFTKVVGLCALFPRWFGQYYASHLTPDTSGAVDILVGAFMFMPRKLYLNVGGFDEDCFMYSDDIDLSYTILKQGRKNYYFHQVTAIHYKGESTVKDKQYVARFSQAMNFFYKKHFRKAILFDFMLKVVAYFFSKAKAERTEKICEPDHYFLLSADDNLQEICQRSMGKKIQRIEQIAQLPIKGQLELMFDTSYMSYAEIIAAMQEVASNKVTYKIVHKAFGFIIGSNSSRDRGTVIQLVGE